MTQPFIRPQWFTGIDDFTLLRIKDVHHVIKDNNSLPNQEAHLGPIKQRNLQVLVWWAKDCQNTGLEIIAAAWTAAELTGFIT